jgi:hypothetical protein
MASSSSEFLVNGKYRLVRKFGSGSFGDIYLGINVANGEVSINFCVYLYLYLIDVSGRNSNIGHPDLRSLSQCLILTIGFGF